MRSDLTSYFKTAMVKTEDVYPTNLLHFEFGTGTVYASDIACTIPTNLISNYTFDVNTTGWLRTDGVTHAVDTGTKYEGASSLKQTATAAGTSYFGISDSYATAGRTFYASAYLNIPTPIASFGTRMIIRFYNASWATLSTASAGWVTATSGWELQTVSATAPANTAHVRVIFDTAVAGAIYWDSVRCYASDVGQAYTALVASWGKVKRIQIPENPVTGIKIPYIEVEIINCGDTVFTDNFTTNVAQNTLVKMYQYFRNDGLTDVDVAEMGRYYIHEVQYTELGCKLRMFNPLFRANKPIGNKLTVAAYPYIDPDDVGHPANIIYGACQYVRCHAVDAGAATTLCTAGGINSTQTTGLKISQNPSDTAFPASGKLYIDSEEITYTSISSGTLGGVTRHTGGTTATTHGYGAAVYSVSNANGTDRTSYIWLIADHPVKAIHDAYADGILQAGTYVAFTGQTGDNHPSGLYNGKAVLDFSAKPTTAKQINVTIVDGVGVSDTIGVGETAHRHNISGTYRTIYGNSGSLGGSGWTGTASSMYDQNDSGTNCYRTDTAWDGNAEKATVGFAAWGGGTIADVRICIAYKATINSGTYSISGGTPIDLPNTFGYPTVAKFTNGASYPTSVVAKPDYNANGDITIYEIWLEVDADMATATAGVTKSGAATKTGTVTLGASDNTTADLVVGHLICVTVDGYQDDGSGTYTGSATALIENPVDVMRHYSAVYGGLTVDTTVSTANRTLQGSNKIAGVVSRGYPMFLDVLANIAWGARTLISNPRGSLKLIYREDSPTSVKSIVKADIAQDMGMGYTSTSEIINSIALHYDFDNSKRTSYYGNYWGLLTASDATSITSYGTREFPQVADFPYIADTATATATRNAIIARYKDAHKIAGPQLDLTHFDIEDFDCVTITHDAPAFGLTSSTKWFAMEVNNEPGYVTQDDKGKSVAVLDNIDILCVEV